MRGRLGTIVLILLIFAVFALVVLAFLPERYFDGKNSSGTGTHIDWNTYQNTEYGFQISYPNTLRPTSTFELFYHLGNAWRAGVEGYGTKGKPILSVPVYKINNSPDGAYTSYPAYFDAEVRIGASGDPQDVLSCYKDDPGYTIHVTSTETINGIVFRTFPLGSAGMMQYLEGVSYRTVRSGTCFAIEQVKAGSTYRDTSSPKDIPDSVLNSYYEQMPAIIRTFKFIAPDEVINPNEIGKGGGKINPVTFTVTLEEKNQSVTMNVSDSFLLKLGEAYDWDVEIDDQSVISKKIGVLIAKGAQGIYEARSVGNAILTAVGDPLCRTSVPVCGAPSILFTLKIRVE